MGLRPQVLAHLVDVEDVKSGSGERHRRSEEEEEKKQVESAFDWVADGSSSDRQQSCGRSKNMKIDVSYDVINDGD